MLGKRPGRTYDASQGLWASQPVCAILTKGFPTCSVDNPFDDVYFPADCLQECARPLRVCACSVCMLFW